jgi:hypothetical protein
LPVLLWLVLLQAGWIFGGDRMAVQCSCPLQLDVPTLAEHDELKNLARDEASLPIIQRFRDHVPQVQAHAPATRN